MAGRIGCVACGLIAGFMLGWHLRAPLPRTPYSYKGQTVEVVRVDTVRVSEPQPPKRIVVVRHDTVRVADTLVALPITQAEYADTACRVWVSGYKPRLDSIHIAAPVMVEVPVRKRKWRIVPAAGVGVTPKGIQPFIGVAITFN